MRSEGPRVWVLLGLRGGKSRAVKRLETGDWRLETGRDDETKKAESGKPKAETQKAETKKRETAKRRDAEKPKRRKQKRRNTGGAGQGPMRLCWKILK